MFKNIKKKLSVLIISLFSFTTIKNYLFNAPQINRRVSNMLILGYIEGTSSGMIIPLKEKNRGGEILNNLEGDIKDSLLHEEFKLVAEYFYQKYRDFNIRTVENMMSDLILYKSIKGDSSYLIIYTYLLNKYVLKYDLGDIYITGTGSIDFETGKVCQVGAAFVKTTAAFNEGIRVFIFSEDQKHEMADFLHCIEKFLGTTIKNSVYIYYISEVNDINNVLKEIEKNKDQFYTKQFLIEKNIRYNQFNSILNTLDIKTEYCLEYIERRKKHIITQAKRTAYIKSIDTQKKKLLGDNNYDKIQTLNALIGYGGACSLMKDDDLIRYYDDFIATYVLNDIFLSNYYKYALKNHQMISEDLFYLLL
jgi:hypothetical protein